MDKQLWREEARCRALTGAQADALFFPTVGAKSKRAKAFCSECPVIKECHNYRLVHSLEGMWAGRTDAEIEQMYTVEGFAEHVEALRAQAKKDGTYDTPYFEFIPSAREETIDIIEQVDLIGDSIVAWAATKNLLDSIDVLLNGTA